ncbi:MAG: hypothetical protein M1815_005975 [Lichina confinis]|nr:MAG: hypothetical protein M1815_005975 [Lichina confinis]
MKRTGIAPAEDHENRKERAMLAAQACETCRTRKTRCDEGRPRCGGCTKLGVECRYEESRPTRKDKNLGQIFETLERLETAVDDLPRRVVDTLPASASPSTFPDWHRPERGYEPPRPWNTVSRRLLAWPAVQEALRDDLHEEMDALQIFRENGPRLVTELERAEGLATTSFLESQPVPAHLLVPDEPGHRIIFSTLPLDTIRNLSQWYFSAFNPTYPVLDSQLYFSLTLPAVLRHGIGESDPGSIITLLVVALGRHALEGSTGTPLSNSGGKTSGLRGGTADVPPGLDFFNEARRRMGFVMTLYTLEHVQIFALAA